MAEALLEILLDNLNSFVRSELATFCGVNGEIKRLTRSLKLIQAVVEDAEQKEITSKPIKIWLQDLKDATHVLDDILDEYSIRSPSHNSGSASQPHCFSLSSFKPNNIWFRYRIGKRLKEISQRLDQISEDRNRHHFVQREVVIREGSIQVPEWRQTFSDIAQPVYGRDGDKDKIVELLLRQAPESSGLFVYPIVGLGGLGKTTLAQLVYNDQRLEIEDVGDEIWNELYHKSFFQEVTTDDDGCMTFKMHDLVHDLAQSVTGKECSVMEDGDITNLPRSTHHIGLRKLEILKLESCYDLRLPEGLTNLQDLRHLIISGSEKGYSLKELHGLNLCQRELSMEGLECVGNVEEAKGVNLIGIKELRVLSLSWGDDYSESEMKAVGVDAEQVIEVLKPHSNLTKLKVYGNCMQLPALGKLAYLEELVIRFMECVEYMDDDECYDDVEVKAFISLKTLELYSMPNLERLLRREGGEMFPRLHQLHICNCPKLTLSCLPSVEKLEISYCEEELVKSISNLHGLKSLQIFYDELKELPTQLKSLHALESLDLMFYDELECIPEQVMEGLCSLRSLTIQGCSALKRLPEAIQHLTSLECLNISDCPILEERCKEGSGEDWHKIQHISNIYISRS
ncbi:putative disease resistance protein RGA1 [Senna tora]|uniref:Putative disease resistance protein RGA1 n=1 Tax=Senna tora TaxID=362788 RepID=A0A834WAX9_9FABA|nr:putative disease resistance protein RGA1 [Senna tora]